METLKLKPQYRGAHQKFWKGVHTRSRSCFAGVALTYPPYYHIISCHIRTAQYHQKVLQKLPLRTLWGLTSKRKFFNPQKVWQAAPSFLYESLSLGLKHLLHILLPIVMNILLTSTTYQVQAYLGVINCAWISLDRENINNMELLKSYKVSGQNIWFSFLLWSIVIFRWRLI